MKERSGREWIVVLAVGALCLGIIGIILGGYGAVTAGDASEDAAAAKARAVVAEAKADTLLEARNTSRLVACGTANDTAKKINGVIAGVEDTLRIAAAPNPNRSPEAQEKTDAFLAGQIAHYETLKVELRDCSPAGIAAYYREDKKP